MSIDEMHKFEQNEMKKKRYIKNLLYDWLIYYIPKPIRKILVDFKNKVISLFKTSTTKDYGKEP